MLVGFAAGGVVSYWLKSIGRNGLLAYVAGFVAAFVVYVLWGRMFGASPSAIYLLIPVLIGPVAGLIAAKVFSSEPIKPSK